MSGLPRVSSSNDSAVIKGWSSTEAERDPHCTVSAVALVWWIAFCHFDTSQSDLEREDLS